MVLMTNTDELPNIAKIIYVSENVENVLSYSQVRIQNEHLMQSDVYLLDKYILTKYINVCVGIFLYNNGLL